MFAVECHWLHLLLFCCLILQAWYHFSNFQTAQRACHYIVCAHGWKCAITGSGYLSDDTEDSDDDDDEAVNEVGVLVTEAIQHDPTDEQRRIISDLKKRERSSYSSGFDSNHQLETNSDIPLYDTYSRSSNIYEGTVLDQRNEPARTLINGSHDLFAPYTYARMLHDNHMLFKNILSINYLIIILAILNKKFFERIANGTFTKKKKKKSNKLFWETLSFFLL